jgi:uncharacterized membrane protein
MESILIILFGVVVILLITSFRTDVQQKFDTLNKNFIAVHKQIKEYRAEQQEQVVKPAIKTSSLAEAPLKDNALAVSYQIPVAVIEKKVEHPESADKKEKQPVTEQQPEIKTQLAEELVTPIEQPEIKALVTEKSFGKTTVSTAFHGGESISSKKEPADYEKLIGENWLNKIGIAVLVIGIGFFVKYAIDKNWIGHWGRLMIGIGTAFTMVGIAHYIRKNYPAFSSVLIGGGIATLYYTISIGYHDYRLFSQGQAFGIMTGITLLASAMSVFYDRKELAIIGLVGGFTAPFMVAGEANNINVFFTYIAILNTGMLLLSFFKKWPVLNRLAFAFTTVYFAGWLMTTAITGGHYTTALGFPVVFFIQFLVMNVSYNLRNKISFNAWEFMHLMSLSGLFYGGTMYVLHEGGYGHLAGTFSAVMGVLFLILTVLVTRISSADKNLVHLLMGKTIALFTLTILVQFDGNITTLAWSVEAVALIWLAQKVNAHLLRQASVVILAIATGGLALDWMYVYLESPALLNIAFNKIVMTGVVVMLAYATSAFLLKKEPAENTYAGFAPTNYRSILLTSLYVCLYLVLLFEVIHQCTRFNSFKISAQIIWLYHLAFAFGGVLISALRKNIMAKNIFFVAGTMLLALYAIAGHPVQVSLRDSLISGQPLQVFYNLHFVHVTLFAGTIFGLWKLSKSVFEEKSHMGFYAVFLSLFGLFIITAEMDMIAVRHMADSLTGKEAVLHHTQVAGYTILWGIYSFALMLFGMRKKIRAIRIFSLVAFSITLVKLFAFDIRNISEGGKIVAFISLGVMLLVISFLYQKLRKLIVDGNVG